LLSLYSCACKGFAQTHSCCHWTLVHARASHRYTVAVTGHWCMQGLHTDTQLLLLDTCACKGFTQTHSAVTGDLCMPGLHTDTRLLPLDTCACKGFTQTHGCCHRTLVHSRASHRHTVAAIGHLCMHRFVCRPTTVCLNCECKTGINHT